MMFGGFPFGGGQFGDALDAPPSVVYVPTVASTRMWHTPMRRSTWILIRDTLWTLRPRVTTWRR